MNSDIWVFVLFHIRKGERTKTFYKSTFYEFIPRDCYFSSICTVEWAVLFIATINAEMNSDIWVFV